MDFGKVKAALEAHGFTVSAFESGAEAARYLNEKIDGKSVAFGGSQTLEEIGLHELLQSHNEVFSHWHVPAGMSADTVREKAISTQIYVSSVNALSETGEIINIDGTGNRVASTLFGHEKVYFVVGKNKIAPTYDDALWRARNIAAPKNAQRLNRKTPCAVKADRCYNCSSPERICRALVVLWEAVKGCATEVVLVNEDLGM